MKELPVMTVRELMEKLKDCDPDAIVISTLWNGWTDTYCAIDYLCKVTKEELLNDYWGTPGETDDRVWDSKAENVVCISSQFEYNEQVTKDILSNMVNKKAPTESTLSDEPQSEDA